MFERIDRAAALMNDETARRRWSRGLALVGVLLCVLAAYWFQQPGDNPPLFGVIAMLPGMTCAALAVWLAPAEADQPTQPLARVAAVRSPRAVVVLAGLVVTLIIVVLDDYRFGSSLAVFSGRLQFVLLCLGWGLIAWGMAGTPRLQRPHISRREALALAGLITLALVLRMWNLEHSLRVFVDEVHLSTGTAYFWQTDHPAMLYPIGSLMPFPRLYPYWMSEAVGVFGHTFTGLRMVPAVLGTLTVAAVYAFARLWLDRPTAWGAALIAATFPPLIHFSRMALINNADPLFGLLALIGLVRGWRGEGRGWFAFAGLALGLTTYFYEGGRLLFPALIWFWVMGMLLAAWLRPRHTPTPDIRGVGVLAATAVLVALPLWVTSVTYNGPIVPRLNDAGLPAEFWNAVIHRYQFALFIERIDNPFLHYVRLADEGRYYGGDTALILPALVPLFLFGVGAVLGMRAGRGLWLLVLWMIMAALGNSLLIHSTLSARFIVVLPALALLIAIGLDALLRLLMPARAGRLFLALAVGVALAQTAYYFGVHLPRFNQQFRDRAELDGYDAIIRAANFPPETGVYLIAEPVPFPAEFARELGGYFNDRLVVDVVPKAEFTTGYMLRLSLNVDQAFFIEAEDTDSLALIRQYFEVGPGTLTPYTDLPEEKTLVLYYYDAP